ncbi:MAG: 6-phosphofructokinase [Myxococcota bacterium]
MSVDTTHGSAVSRVAILTSGGDAPGMNAAIRTATMFLLSKGVEVVGIKRGYRGLMEERFRTLTLDKVSPILREGGTVLGSARCPEFHERATRDEARRILAARGIDGVLVIGGNGSLTGANLLGHPQEKGDQKLAVVGIPASIDNDIGLTSYAIGVDTAINTIVEACDKIADTASAFDRTFLIEVMGRACGYLAMTSAVASGADNVLFPETHTDPEALVETVVRTVKKVAMRQGERERHSLIIKAEGTSLSSSELKDAVDARLAAEEADIGTVVETRVTVLGHVVRGGRPSAFDRLLGSRFANVAVDALVRGVDRHMAAWMMPIAPPASVAVKSPVDP